MARFLFCSLASPGFLLPAIGIAERLRQVGHEVAFVTDVSCSETLKRRRLVRYSRGRQDGPSFQVELWGQLLAIAIQVKHVEYAIAGFKPDVLVGQQLTLGPLIAGERHGIPVALIGLATYIWPSKNRPMPADPAMEHFRTKQFNEMLKLYNEVRVGFGLSPCPYQRAEQRLAGDLFLLRTVPELEGSTKHLPQQVHCIGDCLWNEGDADEELNAWLDESVRTNKTIFYAQHGRFFNSPHFWPKIIQMALEHKISIAAATGRMDALAGDTPSNIFVRRDLNQGIVLARAHAMISSANTTSVLGSVTAGIPSVLIPSGGEQPWLAQRCHEAGIAKVLSPEEASAERIWEALTSSLQDPLMLSAAKRLAQSFARINSMELAADLLSRLAISQTAVFRLSTAS